MPCLQTEATKHTGPSNLVVVWTTMDTVLVEDRVQYMRAKETLGPSAVTLQRHNHWDSNPTGYLGSLRQTLHKLAIRSLIFFLTLSPTATYHFPILFSQIIPSGIALHYSYRLQTQALDTWASRDVRPAGIYVFIQRHMAFLAERAVRHPPRSPLHNSV